MAVKGSGDTKRVTLEFGGEGKRCPFIATGTTLSAAVCLGEECMLWNEEKKDCNINVLAKNRLNIGM